MKGQDGLTGTAIRRSAAFGGFDLLESRVRRFEYAPHRHAEVVIAAYVGGRKLAMCDGKQFTVTAGDLLIIGPETLHAAHTLDEEGWHYRSAYLTAGQIAMATGLSLADVDCRVGGHRLHRGRAGLALDEPLALAEVLIDLLAERQPAAPPHRATAVPASLKLIHDLLRDDPANMPTLPGLTALAGISPEHLSRQFRAAYGLSPFQFLSAARARLAKGMLADGLAPGEAAYAAGFADQSHLTRWFKRIYGVTPGAFAAGQMRSRQV